MIVGQLVVANKGQRLLLDTAKDMHPLCKAQ